MTTTALPKQIQTQFIYELHMDISIQEVYKEDIFFHFVRFCVFLYNTMT